MKAFGNTKAKKKWRKRKCDRGVMRRISVLVQKLMLFFAIMIILVPIFMLLTGSLLGKHEAESLLSPVLSKKATGFAQWQLFPLYPTMAGYVELLLDTPEFFIMFFNSVKEVFPIVGFQFLIATTSAWAFARFQFHGKRILFGLYLLLMILPFQVTMVPNYLVLDKLKLMNTQWSLILPAIFSTFPVFLMTRFFKEIPQALIDAGRIDGASEWRIFFSIGIPLGMPGISSALLLSFFEYWNMIEQPLVFLKDVSKYPVSLYLPNITAEQIGLSLSASVLIMTPSIFAFFWGQEYLEQGVGDPAMKG